jgi:signal transduction histidine kinase
VTETTDNPWSMMGGSPRRFLSSAWPLRSLAYLLTGSVIGLACLLVVSVLVIGGILLAPVLVGAVLLVCLVLLGLPMAALERRRLRLVSPVPAFGYHRVPDKPGLAPWLRVRLSERSTWRELAYTLLTSVCLWPLDLLAIGSVFGLVGSLLLVGYDALAYPHTRATLLIVAVSGVPGAVICLVAALVAAVTGAYALTIVASAQATIARLLLGSREEALGREVSEVSSSRERLVDAFEVEQRRIERDLHDGAQQRLVAVAMKLGLARIELAGVDGEVARLVADAHEDAKRTLVALRDLVRGIRPQILVDRGLGPAVVELADRCPTAVTVDITLPRLRLAVENAAYFVVSEALTNIVKHSRASQAWVRAWLTDGVFTLEIEDDGVGGADMAAGSGLQGLADRVSVVCGTLVADSPSHGPTVVRVTIPRGVDDLGASSQEMPAILAGR